MQAKRNAVNLVVVLTYIAVSVSVFCVKISPTDRFVIRRSLVHIARNEAAKEYCRLSQRPIGLDGLDLTSQDVRHNVITEGLKRLRSPNSRTFRIAYDQVRYLSFYAISELEQSVLRLNGNPAASCIGLLGRCGERGRAAIKRVAAKHENRTVRFFADLELKEHWRESWSTEWQSFKLLCDRAVTIEGESFETDVFDKIASEISNKNLSVRNYVFLTLIKLRDIRYLSLIRSSPDCRLRLQAMAAMPSPEVFNEFIDRLTSTNKREVKNTLAALTEGGQRWSVPLMIGLLNNRSLNSRSRSIKMADGVIFGDEFNKAVPADFYTVAWPEGHYSLDALANILSLNGMPGHRLNLYQLDSSVNLKLTPRIKAAKHWWNHYGHSFLSGKSVPDPMMISSVIYDDP